MGSRPRLIGRAPNFVAVDMDRYASRYVGHNSPKVREKQPGQLVPVTPWPGRSLARRERQTLAGAVWAEAMEDGGFWRAAL